MTDRTWEQAQFEQAQANGQRLDALNAQLAQLNAQTAELVRTVQIMRGHTGVLMVVAIVGLVAGVLAVLGS